MEYNGEYRGETAQKFGFRDQYNSNSPNSMSTKLKSVSEIMY